MTTRRCRKRNNHADTKEMGIGESLLLHDSVIRNLAAPHGRKEEKAMLRRFLIVAMIICFMSILLAPATNGTETTFIFLADPQIDDAESERAKRLNKLNGVLNNINTRFWPKYDSEGNDLHLTCGGQQIGPIHGIFFGGDLSEYGGHAGASDAIAEQAIPLPLPFMYNGGETLRALRCLFEEPPPNPNVWDTITTNSKYKCYFGLGNHDVMYNGEGITPGWRKGVASWSEQKDFYRYQMWNFISQMHAGAYKFEDEPGQWKYIWDNSLYRRHPKYPVTSIDAPEWGSEYSEDCFDWTKYSFNYRVNLPPNSAHPVVSVFQLHNYGGDTNFGRDSGLDNGLEWLDDELKAISLNDKDRPIIIIQHFPFSCEGEPYGGGGPWWTKDHKDKLLAKLEPYNVIAFLTGHRHAHDDPNHPPISAYESYSGKIFLDFRPGAAHNGLFALVRVTDNSFDIAMGQENGGSITWKKGYSKPKAVAGGPYEADEGSLITFDGSGSYGSIESHYWDLDDDGFFEKYEQTVTKKWLDDYSGKVTLKVEKPIIDAQWGYHHYVVDKDSADVTVNNVAPTVEGADRTVDEGADVSLDLATFNDEGTKDTHTATIDWGDESPVENGTVNEAGGNGKVSGSHAYADDGVYTVKVTVTDDDGDSGSDTLTVTVSNAAPTVTIDSVTSPVEGCILPGQELSFAGSFTDPGWLDTHTALWNFGDGNTDPGTLTEENEQPDATGTVSSKHTYSEPGTFNVVLTVQDDEGGTGTAKKDVKVMTASETMDFTISFIQDLPDSCFDKKPEQQKNAFSEKLEAVKNAIAAGGLEGAINKLQNDIRPKVDGSVDGNSGNKDDWITCEDSQKDLCLMVDELVKYLESQQEKKKAEVAQGGGKDGVEEQPEIAEDDSKGKDAVEAAPALLGKFDFAALTAYPQPCNPEVWIPYTLGEGVKVSITIHDVNGRAVRILDLGYQNPGAYITRDKAAHWDGKDKAGEDVASGIYFYTITAGDFSATRKMVVKR